MLAMALAPRHHRSRTSAVSRSKAPGYFGDVNAYPDNASFAGALAQTAREVDQWVVDQIRIVSAIVERRYRLLRTATALTWAGIVLTMCGGGTAGLEGDHPVPCGWACLPAPQHRRVGSTHFCRMGPIPADHNDRRLSSIRPRLVVVRRPRHPADEAPMVDRDCLSRIEIRTGSARGAVS